MKDNIDINDLSFNNLPEDVRQKTLLDSGGLYSPFDIPNGTILYNPWTGIPIQHNNNGVPSKPTDLQGEIVMRNPFNSKIITKYLYKDGTPIKGWKVNDNNEFEEVLPHEDGTWDVELFK